MLPWAAVSKGSLVILPTGQEALVTAAGEPLGAVREVVLSAERLFRPRRIVDASELIPVVFNGKSQALAILSSVFDVQIISEGEAT